MIWNIRVENVCFKELKCFWRIKWALRGHLEVKNMLSLHVQVCSFKNGKLSFEWENVALDKMLELWDESDSWALRWKWELSFEVKVRVELWGESGSWALRWKWELSFDVKVRVEL